MGEYKGKNAVAFGEVLWDVYPKYRKPGGAPLNVLGHLQQLGVATSMISRVGKDDLGNEMIKEVDAFGVGRSSIQSDEKYATGTVKVQLDDQGKPTYDIVQSVAWDHIEFTANLGSLVQAADLFICGTLASRSEHSRSTLIKLLQQSRCTVFDMNLRLDYYSNDLIQTILQETQIFKVNDDEFEVLADVFSIPKSRLYQYLFENFDLHLVIQTRGANGAEAHDGNSLVEHVGYPAEVVDTVGSGDAFLAGFLSKYIETKSLYDCLDFGCKLGAFVATKEGAIPLYDARSI